MGVSVYPCPSDNGESDHFFPDHNPCFYKIPNKLWFHAPSFFGANYDNYDLIG